MSSLDAFAEEMAELVVQKAGPKLLAWLDRQRTVKNDPLMTVAEVATELKLSKNKVYELVSSERLKRAPGLEDIRIRKSVVDAFGR